MTLPSADFLPSLALADQSASDAFGRALAACVVAGFGFHGDSAPSSPLKWIVKPPGAGKTTIVRALLRGLGVEGRIKSPTYTLVEPYVVEMPKSIESRQDVKLHCYHFDFYRFEDPHEWLDAGFRDYFSDAALRLVEWPERARSEDGSLLPPADLHVSIDGAAVGRLVRWTTPNALGAAWRTKWSSPANLAAPSHPVADDSSSAG
jgi:tRNA threonylcarbamoyladenosine biosynthesis protein TsaE